MSRLKRPENKSENPTEQFLSWKSNNKSFAYYSKTESKNIEVQLPLKIAFLEHYHTVKGWHDASESGIYSNEVFGIGSQELTVKAFKGGEIATGLYKDIRSKVRDNGGTYHRSIYAVTDKGLLINLSIKGSVVSAYSDFAKDNSNKFETNWIEIKDFKEMKKGATKYSVPNFTIGDVISKKEDEVVIEKATILQTYMDSYMVKDEDVSETKKYEEKEELDF